MGDLQNTEQKLLSWINQSGLKKKEVAEAIGVESQTLSNLFAGRQRLTGKQIEDLHKAFPGVIHYLFDDACNDNSVDSTIDWIFDEISRMKYGCIPNEDKLNRLRMIEKRLSELRQETDLNAD